MEQNGRRTEQAPEWILRRVHLDIAMNTFYQRSSSRNATILCFICLPSWSGHACDLGLEGWLLTVVVARRITKMCLCSALLRRFTPPRSPENGSTSRNLNTIYFATSPLCVRRHGVRILCNKCKQDVRYESV